MPTEKQQQPICAPKWPSTGEGGGGEGGGLPWLSGLPDSWARVPESWPDGRSDRSMPGGQARGKVGFTHAAFFWPMSAEFGD